MTSLEGSIVWSTHNYTMRGFVEGSSEALPILCKTTAGYSGCDEELLQIGSGEMYWVFDIFRQKRVIATSKLDSSIYLSIPTDYPVKVQFSLDGGTKNVSQPVPMKDVVDLMTERSSPMKIVFENNCPVHFQIGADLGSSATLGVLTVTQSYDEKYLMAYTVHGRSIYSYAHGIPVYMPIEFVIADGLVQRDKDAWFRWKEDIARITKTFKSNQIRTNQEIVLFNEAPPGGEYDYIQLSNLSSLTEKDKIYSGKIFKRDANLYEQIPTRPTNPSNQFRRSNKNDCEQLPRIPAPQPRPDADSKGGIKQELATKLQPGPTPPHRVPPTPKTQGQTPQHPPKTQQYLPKTPQPLPSTPQQLPKTTQHLPTPPQQLPTPHQQLPKSPQQLQPTTTQLLADISKDLARNPRNRLANPAEARRPYEPLCATTSSPNDTYASLSDVPLNVDFKQFSVEEVVDFLKLLKLEKHCDDFRNRNIDGAMVMELDEKTLIDDFEFRSFDAKQFLHFAKNNWRPKTKNVDQ